MWQSPWTAAGSCGWETAASDSVGAGCGAAGRTALAAALQGCPPHCWSLAPSETVTCLNLVRGSESRVRPRCDEITSDSFYVYLNGGMEDSLCAMAMTPDRGMMRFCVCWWLWWELWMFVSVLTGGSPPPEPEIWRNMKEIHSKSNENFHVKSRKLIFKVKQIWSAKQTTDINVDLVQFLLYNTSLE